MSEGQFIERATLDDWSERDQEQRDRIKGLEAKLAKAVAFMNHVADGQSKDYTNNCDLARSTIAELKGQKDE